MMPGSKSNSTAQIELRWIRGSSAAVAQQYTNANPAPLQSSSRQVAQFFIAVERLAGLFFWFASCLLHFLSCLQVWQEAHVQNPRDFNNSISAAWLLGYPIQIPPVWFLLWISFHVSPTSGPLWLGHMKPSQELRRDLRDPLLQLLRFVSGISGVYIHECFLWLERYLKSGSNCARCLKFKDCGQNARCELCFQHNLGIRSNQVPEANKAGFLVLGTCSMGSSRKHISSQQGCFLGSFRAQENFVV